VEIPTSRIITDALISLLHLLQSFLRVMCYAPQVMQGYNVASRIATRTHDDSRLIIHTEFRLKLVSNLTECLRSRLYSGHNSRRIVRRDSIQKIYVPLQEVPPITEDQPVPSLYLCVLLTCCVPSLLFARNCICTSETKYVGRV
jgi:hypothetical protein